MTATGPAPRRRRVSARGRITYFDASDPCAVYRIHNAHGRVIYIGASHDPEARVKVHRSSQPWRREIASWTAEWYPNRRIAGKLELRAIRQEEPAYNFVGTELNVQVNREGNHKDLPALRRQRIERLALADLVEGSR